MMPQHLVSELLDRCGAELILLARQWCDAPEDALQDALCKLVVLSAPPQDPAAWLFRAVRNRAIDLGKQRRRRQHRESASARPDRWFEEKEVEGLDARLAVEALESLPSEQREVIVMRLWLAHNLESIAELLGCSVSTVHRRYEAGVDALRKKLRVEHERR